MKSIFLDSGVTGRSGSSQLWGFKQLFKSMVSSPRLPSCRVVVKGTYTSMSSKVNASSSLGRTGEEIANAYRINEKLDGANFNQFPKYPKILPAIDDEYEGVLIDSKYLPTCPVAFLASLKASISLWRTKEKKGGWLQLPRERSDFIPIALKDGFEYHHAEKGYVMLTYWIPEGSCLLPANASHQVGVGGFVINSHNEVLVVQEKYRSPDFNDCWKLPTGFIHESEEIYAGAVREVREETGIDTEFIEVMAFRHAHNVAFKKSDLLFICMLKPVTTAIKLDCQEIQAAKWMPLDEFIQQPVILGDDMFKKIVNICMAKLNNNYCGLTMRSVESKLEDKSSSLYYNYTT